MNDPQIKAISQIFSLKTSCVVMCLIFSLFFTHKGAGCTEVLAGCACKIVCQAYQGCRHYHTGLSQLPHEELDARGGEHL